MEIQKTTGLLAATFSAFDANKELQLDLIPLIVERLIADGVKGVFVGGTNGEGLSLTLEERMAVTEAYINAAAKRLKVFVHVGHSSIKEAQKLAAHAQRVGADAISAVAAFYFKPSSVENLVDCMAEIAAAAPETPFYYYHMPAATGVSLSVIDFLKTGESKIPNLAGVKYTATTLNEYQLCLKYKEEKFDVLFGYDELLLPALSMGAKGAIGSTYSFAAPMYTKIMDLFRQKKLEAAAAAQYECCQMIQALGRYAPIPTQKEILKMTGLDLGGCRLPLTALTGEQSGALKTYLEEISFFDNLGNARKRIPGDTLVS
ncbi:dihydrodipicolinate synthase family protein [Niabella beijingensis]|uniref:dihydrodipicolinate synthase family protein n=1 Tax=Niabella beijingensis TaxID=2872700 RepID=UPI001CC052B3|nr:dihydrodipicolinate synthase family protein [Niabella beijingensis]MBZ4192458.1 dihydrodipicolinate synthase family protein [Niabella beijingensis]